jgi:hypothetical protein
MADTWFPSLKTVTPQEGFDLATKMARVGVKVTQPSAEIRDKLRSAYDQDTTQLIASSQVIAIHFQTVAPVMAEQMSPAYNITDGRPWKMTMDDGRVTTLVLFENGKGKMTGGPVELSPKWRATPDGLCLKPGPLLPERCVQLVRSDNGYVGMRAGEQLFKLER